MQQRDHMVLKVSNKISFLSILVSLLFIALFIIGGLTMPNLNNQANAKEDKSGNIFRGEPFALFSSVFAKGKKIPGKYTADSANISPPLYWTNVPESTISFAIIVEDPDAPAGTWTHWIIYDIPGNKKDLKEGIKPVSKLPDGSIQATNSFHKIGYGGPSPPPGTPHRYFFTLYALDCLSNTVPSFYPPEKDMAKFRAYLNTHAKGRAQLMGTYGRR